jgi:hypothetical protein
MPIGGSEDPVQLVSAFCVVFYLAIATAIGSRLLWVGVRGRRRPEVLLGAGTLLVAPVALPASIASGFGGPAGQVHATLWTVSELVTQIGIVCLYAFTQQVFRPGVAWARRVIALAAVVLPICLVGCAIGLAKAPADWISAKACSPWILFCQLGYMGVFAWAAIEGLSHYRTAQRRVALGLIDPTVANRFLLFAIYGICCSGISVAYDVAIVLELNIATSLVVVLPAALLSMVSSTAMFLAIFPPAWFIARLRASRPALDAH